MISSDSDGDIDYIAKSKQSPINDNSDDDPIPQVSKRNKIIPNQLSSAEESDDDIVPKKKNISTANDGSDNDFTQEDVFGSDTDDEKESKPSKKLVVHSDDSAPENNTTYQRSFEPAPVQEDVEEDIVEEEAPVPETTEDGAIEVDFPVIKADLGDEMHLVKLPNFLSIETRPFDPIFYEDELDEDEVQDEEGRTRLKLKVENTIRWRYAKDSEGQQVLDPYGKPIPESNARMVRWSDGSFSLHLGREIFDVHPTDISQDHNHLFVREGSGLQAQAVFSSKLGFRPHSTDSFTHRKLTLSLADKTHKASKVKLLPFAGENPDVKQQELARREEARIKQDSKRESARRRQKERASQRELTAAYLEQHRDAEDDEDDRANPHSVSLADIKKRGKSGASSSGAASKKRKSRIMSDMSSTEDEEDASLSELSDEPPKKKANKARIISDDESFSE